jgi:hypothetical protein
MEEGFERVEDLVLSPVHALVEKLDDESAGVAIDDETGHRYRRRQR